MILNMGYYHIELSTRDKHLCTIFLPWVNCEYQKLPMGGCHNSNIFQENIYDTFQVFDMVREYIDNILAITLNNFADHLNDIQKF